jgi:transcriptional regulator with XRE-family HTH domain
VLKTLRVARAEAGLTKVELAARSGVSRDTIARLERGSSEPQERTLYKLAAALGVGVAELLEEHGDRKKGWRPLSAEWALSATEEAFERGIRQADTSRLHRLAGELVGDHYPRTLSDLKEERNTAEQHRQRALAFARALAVRDELLERGEEAPENGLPPLKRYLDALGIS